MIQPSALCNSNPGGCDLPSDRKRSAILFLLVNQGEKSGL